MPLHDYQQTAVAWLQAHPRAALWLDMGLGKTAVSLSALTAEDLPVLVVAPKRVVTEKVWPEEVAKWRPDLKIDTAYGSPAARAAILANPRDIVVLSRDSLADVLPAKIAKQYHTIILDESSGFKSRTSKRFKIARKLVSCPSVRRVWELTGTPNPNGYLDLWSQIFLLDRGERLGKGIGAYRERYFTPGRQLRSGVVTEWLPRPGAHSRINRLLEDIALSMTTDGRIDLPEVTHNRVLVPLPPGARKIHEHLRKNLIVDLRDLGMGAEIHTAGNAAALSNRCSQIAAGFLYVDDADIRGGAYEILHHEKIEALKEIIEGTGSPVLVAYTYRAELEMMKKAIPGLETMDGRDVVKRWNAGQIPVLAVHPASAGMGLNLQAGGHTIVWTSGTWNLELYLQMNKRLARQGQKHPVVIHHLIAPGTPDEAIAARLIDKKSVQDALLDWLESPV